LPNASLSACLVISLKATARDGLRLNRPICDRYHSEGNA
jgi:hypothetical protein